MVLKPFVPFGTVPNGPEKSTCAFEFAFYFSLSVKANEEIVMGLHQNFGKKLIREKKPLFSLQALFAFAPSLWAVIVIEGLFVLYFQIIRYKEPLIIILIIEILFFYLIFLIIFRIKNRNLLKEKSDFRKNDPEIINGELMFPQSISGKSRRSVPDAILEIFYREQKAVYQKVFYSESGSPFSEKYFYCVITDLKLNALKTLYHVKVQFTRDYTG